MRIRATIPAVVAALCAAFVPSAGHAYPFTAHVVAINASGVSDVVFDNGFVYGTQMQSGKLFVIDPTGGTIVTTLTVDVSRTHMLAADDVAHRIYVTNYDAGTMSVIDGAANPPAVIASVPVGTHPVAIDVDTVSKRVFIGLCCAESRSVAVLDASVNPPASLGSVTVGQGPDHIAVDRGDGTVYVANYDSSSVSVLDGRATPPVEKAFLPLPSDAKSGLVLRPNTLAVNPTTHLLYVSVGDQTAEQHQIEIYDTGTKTSVGTIPTAQFIAGDVGVDPIKNTIWYTLPTDRYGNFWALVGDRDLTLKHKLPLPHASVITPNFANFALDPATTRAFGAGQDSIVVMNDDSVAPTITIDSPAVPVAFVPQQIATHLKGTATDDNSGVAYVILQFDLIPTDTIHDAASSVRKTTTTMFVVPSCKDAARLNCTWDRIPNVNAGLYTLHVAVYDVAGNRNADDPTLTVLIV